MATRETLDDAPRKLKPNHVLGCRQSCQEARRHSLTVGVLSLAEADPRLPVLAQEQEQQHRQVTQLPEPVEPDLELLHLVWSPRDQQRHPDQLGQHLGSQWSCGWSEELRRGAWHEQELNWSCSWDW